MLVHDLLARGLQSLPGLTALAVDTDLLEALACLFWTGCRVGGVVLALPPFGLAAVPRSVKAGAGLAFVFFLWGTTSPASPPCEMFPGPVLLLGVGEVVLGLGAGLGLRMVLEGLRLGGELLGRRLGVSEPVGSSLTTGEASGSASEWIALLGLAVFLSAGGDRAVVQSLLESFRQVPAGSGHLSYTGAGRLLETASWTFAVGARLAVPFASVMAVVDLAEGIAHRMAGPAFGPVFRPLGVGATLMVFAVVMTQCVPRVISEWIPLGAGALRGVLGG